MHDDRGMVEYLRNSQLLFKQFFVANFQFSSPRGNDPYLNHILVSHEINGDAIKHQNMHDELGSIIKLEYRFRNKEENFGHKHQKPINFISTFIEHYSEKGMICLDLFGGSGSTMATCQQLSRICYTSELEPNNCQIIIDRMQKCYNLKATKIN
jgi:DNA modification methylase